MGKTDASLFKLKEEMKSQIKNEIENMGDTLGFVAQKIAYSALHTFCCTLILQRFKVSEVRRTENHILRRIRKVCVGTALKTLRRLASFKYYSRDKRSQ